MLWFPSLMLEAGEVIAKRLHILSKGGKRAARESRRMVTEKMLAAAEAGFILGTSGSTTRVIKNYRKRVRANARRFRRSS